MNRQIKRLMKLAIALFLPIVLTIAQPAIALTIKSPSSLTGLIELKQMAKEAIPYNQAIDNTKPTLIEFYADWCTTCQAMASSVRELHQAEAEKINFVMLNIDDPQWVQQVQQYSVNSVPQFTILSARAVPYKTLYGKVPKVVLADLLHQIRFNSEG
jgi:thiol-disulfide isomerase/thioredoxin